MDIQKETALKYQGLFDLMANEHGLILEQSEMDEIIREVMAVVKLFNTPAVSNSAFKCADPELQTVECEKWRGCRKEIELNNRLKKALNITDVTGVLACLKELAKIKEDWNKTEGFEDGRDLDINRDDALALKRTANLIEWLDNYR